MGAIKIFNNNINISNWQNRDQCGFAVDAGADVWRINISANKELTAGLEAQLTPDELGRANRYFQQKDKFRFVISRAALRLILASYLNIPPAEIIFAIGDNKKPGIGNNGVKNISYNISHAGDWILLAVSGSAVGADVEFINPSFDYLSIIDDFFGDGEVGYIREASSVERFYKIWTRKEALTKGTGKGLDEDMRLIPGTDGEHAVDGVMIRSTSDWVVNSFTINSDHAASIAIQYPVTHLRFFQFDFDIKSV